MRRVVPSIDERLVFIQSEAWILRESEGHAADGEHASAFKEYRGSRSDHDLGLPWRDVEQSLLVIVAEMAGADVAVALDFRPNTTDPRVIATAWRGKPEAIDWFEVAPSFSSFLRAVGIDEVGVPG
jgi:hypothetical protein